MKKFLVLIVTLALLGLLFSCEIKASAAQQSQDRSAQLAEVALDTIPIPQVSYFQERRTITNWAKRWDKPSVPTYVYLVSFGKILGYYVADGKPASTRSYVTPETQWRLIHGNWAEVQAPDIDGTYGDNNPGIRFFTAEGVAVEWGGDGASYLYSDAPLPFDVPRLNPTK